MKHKKWSMQEQPRVESLEATVNKKKLSKYDVKLEKEVVQWVESVLGYSLDSNKNLQQNLESGVILCEYVSATIQPPAHSKL